MNRFDSDKNDHAETKTAMGKSNNGYGGSFNNANRGGYTAPFNAGRYTNPRNGAPPRVSSTRMGVYPSYKGSFETKNQNNDQSYNDVEAQYPRYCLLCEKSHCLSNCPSYKSLSVDERSTLCKNKNICFKCLGTGHRAVTCASSILCLQCGGVHHISLHGSIPVTPTNKSATPFVPHVTTFAVKATPVTPTTPKENA